MLLGRISACRLVFPSPLFSLGSPRPIKRGGRSPLDLSPSERPRIPARAWGSDRHRTRRGSEVLQAPHNHRWKHRQSLARSLASPYSHPLRDRMGAGAAPVSAHVILLTFQWNEHTTIAPWAQLKRRNRGCQRRAANLRFVKYEQVFRPRSPAINAAQPRGTRALRSFFRLPARGRRNRDQGACCACAMRSSQAASGAMRSPRNASSDCTFWEVRRLFG